MDNNSSTLNNQKIIITRAISANNDFRLMLEAKGATVFDLPALIIKPPSTWQPLDDAITNLSSFDWLILTSANGVEYFWQRLLKQGKSQADLKNLKIAVVGKKTADYLQQFELSADFIPPDFIADSLVTHFPETLNGKKILFPRVESGGREVLVQELTQQNAIVTEIPAYQSACPEKIDPDIYQHLLEGTITIITFASSKTVRNFYTLLQQALINNSPQSFQQLLQNIKIASIGPQTTLTCKELLNRVDIEAKEYTLDGLAKAIEEAVSS